MRSVMLLALLLGVRGLAPAPATPTLQALVTDTVRVARETGFRATLTRTVQGQRALFSTAAELAAELPAPPSLSAMTEAAQLASRAASSGSSSGLGEAVLKWGQENVPAELAPRFARKLFERLGATYVKLGQFVASSPTLFPAEFVAEFQGLLDATPTVPFATIQRIVEADLGRPLESVYADFDRVPLASASIAQVHGARLREEYGGHDVVVKVRKPGVDDLLSADLGFLEVAAKALELAAPSLARLSLANVVTDLRSVMLEELDFVKEAGNLRAFREWLQSAGLTDVATAPDYYPEASSKRVLTMDRLRGVALTDLDALRKMYGPDFDAEQTLFNALNTWSLSVLGCDFFHADVHAGNLLALPDGRVGFIDFGIVGRVPQEIWGAVTSAAAAVGVADYKELARSLVIMGAAEREVDVEAFARDLEDVFTSLEAVDPTIAIDSNGNQASILVDESQVSDTLLKLVAVTDRNGLKLPREFGLLVKQALYFDRYTRLLAPDVDVLRDDRLEYLTTTTTITTK